MFEDLGVGFMIELKKGEKRLLTSHVIRAANRKTFWEIHQEIRSVQSNQLPSDTETVSWFGSAMIILLQTRQGATNGLTYIAGKTVFHLALRDVPGYFSPGWRITSKLAVANSISL